MAKYKFSCPTCSQHIAYDENAFGRKIRCPNCTTIITVPQAVGAEAQPPVPVRPVVGGGTPPPPPPVRPVTAKPAGKSAVRASTIRKATPKPVSANEEVGGFNAPFALGVGAALILLAIVVGALSKGGGVEADEQGAEGLPLPGGSEAGLAEENEAHAADAQGAMSASESGTAAGGGFAAITREDLRFTPQDTEFLLVIRPAGLSTLNGIEALLGDSTSFSPRALGALLDVIGVEAGQLDLMALAVVDLKLGSRFGYADRRAYLERRIEETRSNTQRKRLQRTLENLPEAPPPDFVGKLRFVGQVDLIALTESVAGAETVANGDSPYVKFRLPQELRTLHRGELAISQTGANTLLFGDEKLIKQTLNGERDVSLAELGLNETDLDGACLLTFVPGSEAKRDILAWVSYKFQSADGSRLPFGEAVMRQAESLASIYLGARGGDTGQIKLGLAVNEDDDVDAARASVEQGVAALVKTFDGLRGELDSELEDSLSESLIGLEALPEGRRVHVAMKLPGGRTNAEYFSVVRRLIGDAVSVGGRRGEARTGRQTSTASPSPSHSTSERATARSSMTQSTPAATGGAPAAVGSTSAPSTERTPPNRTLRGWTMNILHAAVAEQPLSGRVKGRSFQADETVIENGVLILRMGPEDKPQVVLEIHNVQRVGELLDGKSLELPDVSGVNTPSVLLRWEDPTRLRPAVERYYNRFAIKLEFDTMRGGRIGGRVFVALPDGEKSFVNGLFAAEVR